METAFQPTGRFETGYTPDTLGYFLISISIAVLIVWLWSLLHDIRVFNSDDSFRHKNDGTLLVLPKLSPPSELYHAFISHSQQDGGDQVAHIKKELEKFVDTMEIFTDVAAGRHEHALTAKTQLYSAIDSSATFVIFLTKTFFTRKVRSLLTEAFECVFRLCCCIDR